MAADRRDPRLRRLVERAVRAGLEPARALADSGGYIAPHSEWPKLKYFDNGMPHISTSFLTSTNPVNYASAFGRTTRATIRTDEIEAFQELVEYVTQTEAIRSQLAWPGDVDGALAYGVDRLPAVIIDRFLHLHGLSATLTPKRLDAIYTPLESAILQEKLAIDIVVPILLAECEFRRAKIKNTISIERMDDDLLLARGRALQYHDRRKGILAMAATHAFVLRHWEFSPRPFWMLDRDLSEAENLPVDLINRLFAAVRLETSVSNGYAQIVTVPRGWAKSYEADLLPVASATTVAYPRQLEQHGWLKEPGKMSLEQARRVRRTFDRIEQHLTSNPLRIALDKLNASALREDREDAVLDVTIALEALLTDDNREVTHKLALRMAALQKLSHSATPTPSQVFKDTKKIYAYRSAIIHGRTEKVKERILKTSADEPIPMVQLAVQRLRGAIQAILEHPEYLDPERIDHDLLVGCRWRSRTA